MKKINTFKKCAIATLVAGSFMAPVHAQNTISPGFDGFVSGALASSRNKADSLMGMEGGNNSTDTKHELRASVAYTSPSGFGVQLDQVYSGEKSSAGFIPGIQRKIDTTDTAAHLYYRNNLGLIGVFAQQRSYDFRFSADESLFDEGPGIGFFGFGDTPFGLDEFITSGANGALKNRTFMGLEGQFFLGDIELSGQLGTQKQGVRSISIDGDDSSDDLKGNFGSIAANYFLTDNWKVGGRFGFSDFKSNLDLSFLGGGPADLAFKNKTRSYGLQTEYRFDSSPVSVFARYNHVKNTLSFDGTNLGVAKDDQYQVGVKFSFGSGSLRAQSTGGASLNPVRVEDNIATGLIGGLTGLINTIAPICINDPVFCFSEP